MTRASARSSSALPSPRPCAASLLSIGNLVACAGVKEAADHLGLRTKRSAKAAEASLLAGLLVDDRGERLTPSHAVKKGRRYRYYVSAALITDAGEDRAQGWRLAAKEIEEAVIRILADALTSPARLVERFGAAGMPSDPYSETAQSGGPFGSSARWLTRRTSKARSRARREDHRR